MTQLFSVIKKSRTGCILRNTQTKIEREFSWDDISKAFKPHDGCKWLYEANEDSDLWKQAEELSAQMSTDISHIVASYLLVRKNPMDTVQIMVFGDLVTDFTLKYKVSVAEFAMLFQSFYFQMFGVYPDYQGTLTFKE